MERVVEIWDPSALGITCSDCRQEVQFVMLGLGYPGSGRSRKDWSAVCCSQGEANLRLKQFAKAHVSEQRWYLNDLNCSFSRAPKLLLRWRMLHSRELMTLVLCFLLGVMTTHLGIVAVISGLALPSLEESGRVSNNL